MTKVGIEYEIEHDAVSDLEPTPTVTVRMELSVEDARTIATWRPGYACYALGNDGPGVVVAVQKALTDLDG